MGKIILFLILSSVSLYCQSFDADITNDSHLKYVMYGKDSLLIKSIVFKGIGTHTYQFDSPKNIYKLDSNIIYYKDMFDKDDSFYKDFKTQIKFVYFDNNNYPQIYIVKVFDANKLTEKKETQEPTQCKGFTKSGKQCNRMISDPSGYCWQHK